MVARLTGSAFVTAEKDEMRIAVENASATKGLGQKLANLLRDRGYRHVFVRASNDERPVSLKRTKIIAQRGNPEDAEIVKADLLSHGDIVTASVGDIESSITIMVGDDLAPVLAD
jgi:NAD(P)-dependent dehydrogenase (short-subunit alcohol dehydrogenase family)